MQTNRIRACGLAHGSDPKVELHLPCSPRTAPHSHLTLLPSTSASLLKCAVHPEMPCHQVKRSSLHPPMATTLAKHLIILYLNCFQNYSLCLHLTLVPHGPTKLRITCRPCPPIHPYKTPLPIRQISSLCLPETQSFFFFRLLLRIPVLFSP